MSSSGAPISTILPVRDTTGRRPRSVAGVEQSVPALRGRMAALSGPLRFLRRSSARRRQTGDGGQLRSALAGPDGGRGWLRQSDGTQGGMRFLTLEAKSLDIPDEKRSFEHGSMHM